MKIGMHGFANRRIVGLLGNSWRNKVAIGVAAAFILIEVAARLLGMVDFPLYDANAMIGYIPKANQSGAFLNKNTWQFNAQHMGAEKFVPGVGKNILLVGDSLVLGGNTYRQEERLGHQLQAKSGWSVWPIAAGSWALRNELAYLRMNPEVVKQVNFIVFVSNSADFAEASSWSCELTHPRTRPMLAAWYLFKKNVYGFGECDGEAASDMQVPPGDVAKELATFLAGTKAEVLFVLYPDRAEMASPELRTQVHSPLLALLRGAGAQRILEVASNPRWSLELYKDGIHPTPTGNRILAEVIADTLVSAPHK